MKGLTDVELKEIYGGGLKLGFFAGVVAGLSFLIGFFEGLVNPVC